MIETGLRDNIMPYYVFKMSSPEGMELVKNLELIGDYESFREAKNFAKEQRAALDTGDTSAIKVMFADNQLLAEEQLLAYREKPVVMEHEK
jgi:GTPase